MTAAVKAWLDHEGRLLRLRLARPKANVLDAAMVAGLDEALARHADMPGLLGILVDHEGPNFSFGASVEEHLPAQCAAMLKGFHALILRVAGAPVPVMSAVRGQCLGGGLELALAGSFIFAAPDARLGQPEIVLGVFAPAATALLPPRVGQARAEDLLLSGRTVDAAEAHAIGLVDAVADDPTAAALAWFDRHLVPRSASSLRHAVKAVRGAFASDLAARLAALEALYLNGLMATHDAKEGLEAFLAKRPARWEHR
ncbi:MAG: cyclohexa-1,5-dienecarbonyl-CoA hydratase [Alphaproteobacteria bacterium]|nr:cyclohexa-1,5-dienecarbonyl-CoA hydratase [Alphaproteobacteria bacterium]